MWEKSSKNATLVRKLVYNVNKNTTCAMNLRSMPIMNFRVEDGNYGSSGVGKCNFVRKEIIIMPTYSVNILSMCQL